MRSGRPRSAWRTLTGVAENPLLEGLDLPGAPDPCVLVIFGASGDLTKRKLFPALYALAVRAVKEQKKASGRR